MVSRDGAEWGGIWIALIYVYDLGDETDSVEILREMLNTEYYTDVIELYWESRNKSPLPTIEYIAKIAMEKGVIEADSVKEAIRAIDREAEKDAEIIDRLLNEALKSDFNTLVSYIDRNALSPIYLDRNRYVRIRLCDLTLEPLDDSIKNLIGDSVTAKLNLLIHNIGIAVAAVLIRLKPDKSYTTDQVIMIRRKIHQTRFNIGMDSRCRRLSEDGVMIGEFIDKYIVAPLKARVIFRDRYRRLDEALEAFLNNEIDRLGLLDRVRYKAYSIHNIIYIFRHECSEGCRELGDVLKKHPLEIYGIYSESYGWRGEDLEHAAGGMRNLLSWRYEGYFISEAGDGLYINVLEGDKIDLKQQLLRIYTILSPAEFLSILDMALYIYNDLLRKVFEGIRSGAYVTPSELARERRDIVNALEEYHNIEFTSADPTKTIIEEGRRILRLEDRIKTIEWRLDTILEDVRIRYEEEISRRQEYLGKMQVILAVLFGILGILSIGSLGWEISSELPIDPYTRLIYYVAIPIIISTIVFIVALLIIFRRWWMR